MEKVLALKQGDHKIFSEVFEMSFQKSFNFFMKRMNSDSESAKELTQLTYIKLWQSRHTLSELHSLDKQLFIMAKCVLIDYLRKEAHTIKTSVASTEYSGIHAISTESKLASFESDNYIADLLKNLPPARKKIMRMKFSYGFSNKQISESLSISIKTVEDHVAKGLQQLRLHTKQPVTYTLLVILSQLL